MPGASGHIIKLFILLLSLLIPDQTGKHGISTRTGTVSAALSAESSPCSAHALPAPALPEDVGMDGRTLSRIDQIARAGMKAHAYPGCQVVVWKEGRPVYDKCFGSYTYASAHEVKPATLYDLASLSKTTGTLLAVMKLYDLGKLKLTDKASEYLTFLRGTDKETITVSELLFHESGLPAALPFYNLLIESKRTVTSLASSKSSAHKKRKRRKRFAVHRAFRYKEGWISTVPSEEYTLQAADSVYVHRRFHDAAMQMIADARLYGKSYCYSDINFILLKEIAEAITGEPMDAFLEKEFFGPMSLHEIGYLPLRTHKKEEVAPTLQSALLRNGTVQGFVHDPLAVYLGGVSGNAGLFASARDVAAVYQMLLNGGEMDGQRYLSAETCRLFTTTTSADGRRGLGFDKPFPARPKKNPCSPSAPLEVYGHTGYTGTCCWVDPINKVVYVFLSNRTYPNDGANKLARMSIRPRIQEVIYESIKQ